MKIRKVILYLIVLNAISFSTFVRSQTFNVRVLDALNGKPYNDMTVNYYCISENPPYKITENKSTVTDANGFAVISNECKEGQQVQIYTGDLKGKSMWTGKVEECGYLGPQSIEQILLVGLISKPTAAGGIWCPANVSKKLKPIPGQVIIFAKKPTWWQKHVAP